MDTKKQKTDEQKAKEREIRKQKKAEDFQRFLARSQSQVPLSKDERKRLRIELDLNKQDVAFIEEVFKSRRHLHNALYDLRFPDARHHRPLQEQTNTGEEDLLMMDATTLGFAVGEGDLLTVDPSLLPQEA